MQKWEYRRLRPDPGQVTSINYSRGTLDYFLDKPDKSKGEHQGFDVLHRLIAILGNEGWEMFSIEVIPVRTGGTESIYWFKRPLP